jgi:hypothetical protein
MRCIADFRTWFNLIKQAAFTTHAGRLTSGLSSSSMRSSSTFISLNLKIKEEVDELASSEDIFWESPRGKRWVLEFLSSLFNFKKEGKSGELRVESFVTYMNN